MKGAVGICPYCHERIYEPFITHCDGCREYQAKVRAIPIRSHMLIRADARHIPLKDCTVDAIVTDPPYGLEFMGKEWDSFRPAKAYIRQPSRRDSNPDSAHNTTTQLVTRNVPEAYVAGYPYQKWATEWALEALRVCKPGAYLLAFGGTRTYHRLTCAIEDAGWEIRD